jgi:outer membrane protein assembly factor BamA
MRALVLALACLVSAAAAWRGAGATAVAVAQPDEARPSEGSDSGSTAPDRGGDAPGPGDLVPVIEPPVLWTEWDVVGTFLEPIETVRKMLEPHVVTRRALTDLARTDLATACAALGYQLIELTTDDVAGGGVRALLHLEPIPMIRSVEIDLHQSLSDIVLDDQVRRRLRLGPGTYVPYEAEARRRALRDEADRIEEYLRDEGFFDARAVLSVAPSVPGAVRLRIDVHLGSPYDVGAIGVDTGGGTAVSPEEIRAVFRHRRCVLWKLCLGTRRFTRDRLRQDLEAVVALYKQRGYPAVRVQTDFSPGKSADRRSRTVRFNVFVDQRRQLDVVFEGNDDERFTDAVLRKQLTFDAAGSADDLEANDSATAIAAFYQARGYFETQVSWTRERFDAFDRIVFRVDPGQRRVVRRIEFDGNQAVTDARLRGLIATKIGGSRSVFSDGSFATGAQLDADVERIRKAYEELGYLQTNVTVYAAPTTAGTTSAAMTAAIVAADQAPGDLQVRFQIDEGARTFIGRIEVTYAGVRRSGAAGDQQFERCAAALATAAAGLGAPAPKAERTDLGCRGSLRDVPLTPSRIAPSADQVREALWDLGYPNATVEGAAAADGARTHRVVFDLRVNEGPALVIGTVIIRGNFRTHDGIVLDQLGFTPGAVLTAAKLSQGPAAVRATALFDSVTLELASGEDGTSGPANFVVRVRERYDRRLQVDLEGGWSSQNSFFGKLKFALPNLAGVGLYADLALTGGSRYSAIEGTGRVPRWLVGGVLPVSFDAEVLGFYRQEETVRFGSLVTEGFSFGLSRTWERAQSRRHLGRLITGNLRYDYRQRNRDEEPFRAAGPDADLPPVPVTTRTGSIGLSLRWDQRYDRSGNLNPLSPERGFLIESDASLASPALAGQDLFIKLSASVKRYQPLGARLTLRSELRVDQGIPLGGAVLLPEVERYFGGR